MTDDSRKRAEEILRESREQTSKMPPGDVRELLHELRVRQDELETQNEELRRAQLELASSRDRYADLYEFAPVGYVTLDENRIVRESNLTFTSMIGVERRHVIGKRLSGFVAPDHQDQCSRTLGVVLTSRTEQSFEAQFQHSGGWHFWGQVRCVPNEPDSGWPGGCRVTISDVTPAKATERMLQESMKRLELALEAGEMGLWQIDLEKNEAYWNEQLYRLLGYAERVDVTPEDFYEHIHEDDRSRVRRRVEASVAEGSEFIDEFRVVRRDGATRWMAARGRVRHDSQGNVVGMTGVNYDTTFRKQMEERLQELVTERSAELAASERRYRELIENMSEIVYSMDENGVVLFVSRQAERYGMRAEDVVGRHFLEFVVPDDRQRIEREFRRTLSTGEEFPSRFRLHHPGDTTVWFEETGRLRRDAAGDIVGITGVLRDVTERVAAEEEILRQREALSMLASRLADAQEDERQRIAAGLHDEVAQTLAACQIKLAEAEGYAGDKERSSLLEEANRLLDEASDEIRGLTFELSTAALFQSGFGVAARELCAHMSKRYGVALEVECPLEEIAVPRRLRPPLYHGLRELLYNVVKHAEVERASVRVEMIDAPSDRATGAAQLAAAGMGGPVDPKTPRPESPGHWIRIAVRDEGKGFDASALDRPLTREGGFGLRHLRQRMEDLGGRFRVRSVPGDGTEAVIEVPLGAGSPPLDAASARAKREAGSKHGRKDDQNTARR